MPRNSSGSYVLPSGNPVVTRTLISSLWSNTTFGDIASELSSSLDRSGRGPMLAPLLLSSGVAGAPGLSFAAEATSGLYRAGTNDLRMQIASNTIAQWLATGLVVPVGITATQSTTNGAAVTATGNGTGPAVSASGGNSGGAGVSATGGGTSGIGVSGTGGSSNGTGVSGIGGGTAGVGVRGLGTGASSGGSFTGGATSGAGVHGIGGASNGNGAWGEGTGSGSGGLFTGGAANGAGVTATGGSFGTGGVFAGGVSGGDGLLATGGGASAKGVHGVGGAAGYGVYAEGGSNGSALYAGGNGTGKAIIAVPGGSTIDAIDCQGSLDFFNAATLSGAPNSTVADKCATYANTTRAWASVVSTGTTGSQTLQASYNIASAVLQSPTSDIKISWNGFSFSSGTSYTIQLTLFNTNTALFLNPIVIARSATDCTVRMMQTASGVTSGYLWTAASAGALGLEIEVKGY